MDGKREQIIALLRQRGPVGATYAELAELTGLTRASVTGRMKTMRKHGLVRKLNVYRPDGAAVVALRSTGSAPEPEPDGWYPFGAVLEVHNVLQDARRSNARYVAVDYIAERVQCTRNRVNIALHDLHQHGYCQLLTGRTLQARGTAPSDLPRLGDERCEQCFGSLDGRMRFCRTCMPVDLDTPHTQLKGASGMKVMFLAERYAAGLPLWA